MSAAGGGNLGAVYASWNVIREAERAERRRINGARWETTARLGKEISGGLAMSQGLTNFLAWYMPNTRAMLYRIETPASRFS